MTENYNLKIDPELKYLVLPLSKSEKQIVEDEICESNAKYSIRTWNDYILVDYDYYDYYRMLQLPYETTSICLNNKEEAIAWVCENQTFRKGLPEEMRRYLIGKRSIMETALGAHEYVNMRQHNTRRMNTITKTSKYDSTITQTRERLAAEYSIGVNTVRKYEMCASAVDQLREIVPEFIDKHLSGYIKVSIDRLEAMAQLSPSQLHTECAQIKADTENKKSSRWKKRLQKEIQENAVAMEAAKVVSIKDMPVYDPDSEISSLSLTIPSWISSIERVLNVTKMSETSRSARIRLDAALNNLKNTSDVMLQRLWEVNDGRLF